MGWYPAICYFNLDNYFGDEEARSSLSFGNQDSAGQYRGSRPYLLDSKPDKRAGAPWKGVRPLRWLWGSTTAILHSYIMARSKKLPARLMCSTVLNITHIFEYKTLDYIQTELTSFIEQYGKDAHISFDSFDNFDDSYTVINLKYTRPETDAEYETRLKKLEFETQKEKERKQQLKDVEYSTYLKLKAKFEKET